MAEPLVDVANLMAMVGQRTLVGNVTIHLAAGDIIGLVGANGGGKTTTLRLIAGLLRPASGRGIVLGEDIRSSRRPWHRLGYMAQKVALYPELTVRENLRFRADMLDLADRKAQLDRHIDTLGLTSVAHQRIEQLSGGWAKRAQFAATTLHQPTLLLLDEPTAGLDAVTRRDLWQLVEAHAAAGGAALISTHDLAEAERLSRIIFYRDGRADAECAPAALMAAAGASSLEAAIMTLAVQP